MSESGPQPQENMSNHEALKKEKLALAKEMINNSEAFLFAGILPDVYEKLKIDEAECPGMSAPIDELIERCKQEGVKVVLSTYDSESANIMVLPKGIETTVDNIIDYNFRLNQLVITEDMDESLKNLIMLDRETAKK